MIEAVLFDWGDTLMRFVWDDALMRAGHRAGLSALGLDELPEADALTAHFRDRYIPLVWQPGTLEEVEYPGLVRDLLRDFGIEVDDEAIERYLVAEHAAWEPARQLGPHTLDLLDGLRARGLRIGLVSNAIDPGWILRRDIAEQGIAERLDGAVFSAEVGWRKPHPAIFERALADLGVAPERALFVGDRLYEDVRGAAEAGMRTVQALWFREDSHPEGGRPDFRAAEPLEVLDLAERLLGH